MASQATSVVPLHTQTSIKQPQSTLVSKLPLTTANNTDSKTKQPAVAPVKPTIIGNNLPLTGDKKSQQPELNNKPKDVLVTTNDPKLKTVQLEKDAVTKQPSKTVSNNNTGSIILSTRDSVVNNQEHAKSIVPSITKNQPTSFVDVTAAPQSSTNEMQVESTTNSEKQLQLQTTATEVVTSKEVGEPKSKKEQSKIAIITYSSLMSNKIDCTELIITEKDIKAAFENNTISQPEIINSTTLHTLAEGDMQELIQQGYTRDEISHYLSLGLTPLVVQKLKHPKLQSDVHQSVDCITSCIMMGKKEVSSKIAADLLLILGGTGTGKSTTGNYLYGCQMVGTKVGKKHVVEVSNTSKVKAIMPIGHAKSKTFIPQVVYSDKIGISLCDCPGYDDSRGSEINISNAVNTRHAIENAKSVRILLLIDYNSRYVNKSSLLNNLVESLNKLLGQNNSLIANQESILIGITQVPISINDERLLYQDVIDEILELTSLPKEFKDKIKIVDPLERRKEDLCGHEDWINAIKALKPVSDHRTKFNTVLTKTDEIMLIEVSKEISKLITKHLAAGELKAVVQNLEKMAYLNIIRHERIKELYQENLKELNVQLATEERAIRQLINQNQHNQAYKALLKYKENVLALSQFDDSLKEKLLLLVRYMNDRLLAEKIEKVKTAIYDFTKAFDQNVDLQRKLATQIHISLNLSQPTIHEKELFPYLPGFLQQLIKLEQLEQFIFPLVSSLIDLQMLSNNLDKTEELNHVENLCFAELQRVAKEAKRVHEELAIAELRKIKITVLELLDKIKNEISWQINGKQILPLIQNLGEYSHNKETIKAINSLSVEPSIQATVAALSSQLGNARKILKTLPSKLAYEDFTELSQIASKAHSILLNIKTVLSSEKHKEEERIRQEREKQHAEQFSQQITNLLAKNEFKNITNLVMTTTKELSAFQLQVLKDNKIINASLKEKISNLMENLQNILIWEKHGKLFLERTSLLFDSSKNSSIATRLSALKGIDLDEPLEMIITFFEATSCLAKLFVINQPDIDHVAEKVLLKVRNDFALKQKEEAERIAKENRRKEAIELISKINNVLLPNYQLTELKLAIERLSEIAPDQLETITFKNKIEEHKQLLIEELNTRNYDAVKNKLELLNNINEQFIVILTKFNISIDIVALNKIILNHISAMVTAIQQEVLQAFDDEIIREAKATLKPMTRFGEFFNAVDKFKHIKGVNEIHEEMAKNCIVKILIDRFNIHGKKTDIISYTRLLIQAQRLTSEIGPRNTNLTLAIRTEIGKAIEEQKPEFLSSVCQSLLYYANAGSEISRYANEIIGQYPAFKRAEVIIILDKTKARKAANISSELKISNKDVLMICFGYYQKEYEDILRNIITKRNTEESVKVLNKAVAKAREYGKRLENTTHYSKHPETVGNMIANIFGVWSYLDAYSGNFIVNLHSLRQPHATQTLSILLLLGMDELEVSMRKHFLQVKTGEGKSIIAAGAAVAFALMGYKIDVACYNPWLARRDARDFSKLYNQFDVEEQIIYGDFKNLVDVFSKSLGNIRLLTQQFMKGVNINVSQEKSKKSVLFVDEVDVLFNEHTLGSSRGISVQLPHNSYRSLLQKIWRDRLEYIKMSKQDFVSTVRRDILISEFLNDYPNYESLLDIGLDDMYEGLQAVHHGQHTYVCYNKAIGYVDNLANTVRTTTKSGHATAFASLKEFERDAITKDVMEYNCSIFISCGQFSLAELPNSYNTIMGVTGTLFSLSPFENALLERYNIDRRTDIPSAFEKKNLEGKNRVRIFGKPIDARDNKGYFSNIKNAVEVYIRADRAVLLVFESEERLQAYRQYIINYPYNTKTIKTNVLVASTDDKTRDLIISEAASRARVTEMTREFGRGTDFVCRDSQLRESGGVAVICTFFPNHEAEEIQIQGRTCRQDDPGSFEMILYLDDLDKTIYHTTTLTDIEQQPDIYTYLSTKRREYQTKRTQAIQELIDSAKKQHDTTLKYAKLLSNNSIFSKIMPGSEANDKAEALSIIRKYNIK